MAEDVSPATSAVRISLVLAVATLLALLVANSGAAPFYKSVLAQQIGFEHGPIDLKMSVKEWVKNLLMAVFFLLVSLEIKVEFREGALADAERAVLPFIAAFGGMIAPALVYLLVIGGDDVLERGWAIPTATDIAFVMGIVGLLGRLVSPVLRTFLLAVAVIDDLGAILVIALFYTGAPKAWAIFGMALCVMALAVTNLKNVEKLWPYLGIGALLWFFTQQSGINATLAGVIAGAFVPLRIGDRSPLHHLAHLLHRPVQFGIMPVFAFAAAGVSLQGMTFARFIEPLTLAIMLGLVLGKPSGIFATVWLASRLGIASRPPGVSWLDLLGAGCLAGIGFTMSLFVGALAFSDEAMLDQVRLGVLSGSTIAACLGILVLWFGRWQNRPGHWK